VPGASEALRVLTERGLVVKPPSLAGPAPRASGELPLEDEQARSLASAAKAEIAVVVGAELSERQRVRGVAQPMVLASASARAVATGRQGPFGEGSATAVGIAGDGERDALDRAIAQALGAALPSSQPSALASAPVPSLVTDDQPLPPADGGAWIRVSAKTPWSVVTALMHHLAKQPGFSTELRRLSPAGYLILVRAQSGVDRAGAIARSTPMPEGAGALKVRTERGVIAVHTEAP
jgi:hypothetical protein